MVERKAKRKTSKVTTPVIIIAVFICLAVIPYYHYDSAKSSDVISPVIPIYEIRKDFSYNFHKEAVLDFPIVKPTCYTHEIYIIGIKIYSQKYVVGKSGVPKKVYYEIS